MLWKSNTTESKKCSETLEINEFNYSEFQEPLMTLDALS